MRVVDKELQQHPEEMDLEERAVLGGRTGIKVDALHVGLSDSVEFAEYEPGLVERGQPRRQVNSGEADGIFRQAGQVAQDGF